MKIGKIVAVNVEGNKRTVDVQLSPIERAIDVAVPLGTSYDLAVDDQVVIHELDGNGDPVAVPGSWFNAALSTDFVALKADVDSLKSGFDDIKTIVNTHIHPATVGVISATVTPVTAVVVIVGSNKFKVTHD